jgi:Holliday junction resolvase
MTTGPGFCGELVERLLGVACATVRAAVCRRRRSWCSTRAYHGMGLSHGLTYVSYDIKLTYMEKTQVYLRKEELEGLRHAAARSGRSVADLIREAIRKVILRPPSTGPVALWDGEPKRTSIEHDSVHDDP